MADLGPPVHEMTLAQLDDELVRLEGRLTAGWSAIDRAIAQGSPDVARYEQRWTDLLLRYEAAHRVRDVLRQRDKELPL